MWNVPGKAADLHLANIAGFTAASARARLDAGAGAAMAGRRAAAAKPEPPASLAPCPELVGEEGADPLTGNVAQQRVATAEKNMRAGLASLDAVPSPRRQRALIVFFDCSDT